MNIRGIDPTQLAGSRDVIDGSRRLIGLVPNTMYTMGRRRALLGDWMTLVHTVYANELGLELTLLVGYVSSLIAGCRYVQAHVGFIFRHHGFELSKLTSVADFENQGGFSPREKAVLALARDASKVPNAATRAHFDNLRDYYSEEQLVDLVAVIALFGFNNRWHDTVATTLEKEAVEFASEHLAPTGWEAGRHA